MAVECFPVRTTKENIKADKVQQIKAALRDLNIPTICESARCPNIGECFTKPSITFMILGGICSRGCTFCSMAHGQPKKVDFEEVRKIVEGSRLMGIKHIVITSVSRDDLADGGALHFAHTMHEISKALPSSTLEVLAPDFNACRKAIRTILDCNPHIFNHNIKTVPRLFPKIRSKSNYEKSLKVLKIARKMKKNLIMKSGFMVGLGETEEEIMQVMLDLVEAGCDILTIGQYFQLTRDNVPADAFLSPDLFVQLKEEGMRMGFRHVESAPFVRSCYNNAEYAMQELQIRSTRKGKNAAIPPYPETATVRI